MIQNLEIENFIKSKLINRPESLLKQDLLDHNKDLSKKILSFVKCDTQNKLIFLSKKKQIKYSFNENLKRKCLELFNNIS